MFPIDTQEVTKPTVGIGIVVELSGAPHDDTQIYHGEYIWHCQHKTEFLLRSVRTHQSHATEHIGEYHGKVLKLAKEKNIEPEVLQQAQPLIVMTSLLFEAEAVDDESGQRYFCWITDRCIPLNQLFKLNDDINRSSCILGAYLCILRATQWYVYVVECGLQNFGLVINHKNNMHTIAFLDAHQWQCEHAVWPKSKVNRVVMQKFWEHCNEIDAEMHELRNNWQQCTTMNDALDEAARKWNQIGAVVTYKRMTSHAIAVALNHRQDREISLTMSSPTYRIIRYVGQAVAPSCWSDDCVAQCYRAADTLCLNLSPEDEEEISDLHSRIVNGSESIQQIMQCWLQLHEFRRSCCDANAISSEDASELIRTFKDEVLYDELTPEQQTAGNASSILNAILHKRTAYTHAASAIMQYGLPHWATASHALELEEHIQRLADFTVDMVTWLQAFASSMRSLRQCGQYQKRRRHSDRAREEREARK